MKSLEFAIVIPIKTKSEKYAKSFAVYLRDLVNELSLQRIDYEIIVADESNQDIFDYIELSLSISDSRVIHFAPAAYLRTGDNDKLNGIYSALEYITKENTFIIDDHYRVTVDEFLNTVNYLTQFDIIKGTPRFEHYDFTTMVDMSAFFFRAVVNKNKQYSGHLVLKTNLLKTWFPPRDGLFDEYIMEEYYINHGARSGFPRGVFFTATQSITFSKFMEQRIRYSYENIGFKVRFISHLCLIPFFISTFILNTGLFFIALSFYLAVLLVFSAIGQVLYGDKHAPKYIFIFSILWHLFYWFTSWIALILFLTTGIDFGGRKIKSPR